MLVGMTYADDTRYDTDLLETLSQRVVVGDGAMGTQLQAADLTLDDFRGLEGCNEILNETRPDVLDTIHRAYFEAGADAVETNTFGCNLSNLGDYDIADKIRDLSHKGTAIARRVADELTTGDRKRYVITDAGTAEVERWLSEPAPPEPGLHSVLFTKVVLAVMLGRPADRFLDLQRAAHLQRMHELTELKRSDNVADVLLADHGLYHLEADLRWIDHTAARLDLLDRAVRR